MSADAGGHLGRGSCVLLESDTGTGKTEAALIHFMHLLDNGQVDGCFFALPTRTSAAQLHKRVSKAVNAIFGDGNVPVTMAVPGYLDPHAKEAIIKDGGRRSEGSNWFAENSKRYLASRIAVGTVDQLLMSVLESKHSTLRFASSARHLLVVDEVHASDAYMTHLLGDVVERHTARGGHTFLMSATLGSAAAESYFQKAGKAPAPHPTLRDATALPYPCVRHVMNGHLSTTALPSSGYRKQITVTTRKVIHDADAVAQIAAGHVRRGAKVIVIRNTVRDCIAVQRKLEQILEPSEILRTKTGYNVPHHGRYAREDRFAIDEAIEGAFGKGSPSKGIVAVGTQTIEQSLDIDADILITDICPIDVLLQRLGRLHRHPGRGRPEGYETPVAVILESAAPLEEFAKKAAHGIGRDRAYQHIGHVLLTLREIRNRGVFVIPEDNRYLVEACTHDEFLLDLVNSHPVIATHDGLAAGADLGMRSAAQQVVRKHGWLYGDKLNVSMNAGSRIGDPGLRVEMVCRPKSALGFDLSGLTIPSWMLDKDISYEEVVDIGKDSMRHTDHAIQFNVGSTVFSYGRYGLEKTNADSEPS